MNNNEIAQSLHDKATRGLPLSDEEKEVLEAWYKEQDEAEQELLSRSIKSSNSEEIQEKIEQAASQIFELSKRIHELTIQNEALRKENAALQKQLARPDTQAA